MLGQDHLAKSALAEVPQSLVLRNRRHPKTLLTEYLFVPAALFYFTCEQQISLSVIGGQQFQTIQLESAKLLGQLFDAHERFKGVGNIAVFGAGKHYLAGLVKSDLVATQTNIFER